MPIFLRKDREFKDVKSLLRDNGIKVWIRASLLSIRYSRIETTPQELQKKWKMAVKELDGEKKIQQMNLG